MFIKINFYTDKTHEVIASDYDAAFAICLALDNCDNVRQWNLDDIEHCCAWYKKGNNWKKLLMDWKDWDYS